MKMMGLIKFRVEPEISFLMQDEEFKRRVIAAYEVQVEANNGWGFTVRYKGYRVRFNINSEASCRGVITYVGYAEEKPETVQKTLFGGQLNAA
jgi:hypothetical protein